MAADFAPPLLAWFAHHRADWPWRRQPTPYHVWLAETMLQQTTIATVIPYYQRFIRHYPSIQELAAAPIEDVLKLWEGLGYYRRARNLHKAASIILNEHGGAFPDTAADLLKLPGIGPYTAGAIASIAFGRSAAVLDGNVIRVFTRLLDLDIDVSQPANRQKLWGIAADWAPTQGAGDYNQALMELGQTICRPKNPRCGECPIQAHCQAFANGSQAERPVKKKRPAIPHYDVAAGLIRDRAGRLLIAQRPLEGLLGGLWKFPGGRRESDESLTTCLERELADELAIRVEVGELFQAAPHAFTHFKITLHAFDCRYLGAVPPYAEPQAMRVRGWAWARQAELNSYSFGRADRKIIEALARRQDMLF